MKSAAGRWMLLILLMGAAVSSSTGLYFMKGDKDFDEGERSQDDRQFQHSKKPVMPKNRAESVPDVKENEIALSQVEPNDPPGRKAVKEVPKHFRISNLLEEVDPGTGEGIEEDDDDNEGDSEDSETDEEPTIFALANTDVGRNWEGIPFREKYLWGSPDALCHPFDLPIPHEGTDDGNLTICLYRREMPSSRDVSLLVIPEISDFMERKANVYGHVNGYPKSSVMGHLQQGRFFGVISLDGSRSGLATDYVVENVNVLTNLMKHSKPLLRNLVTVMDSVKTGQGAGNEKSQLNAIVTTGTSLQHFMAAEMSSNRKAKGIVPFLCLSTGHNSFIISGEPTMTIDEKGRTVFSVGKEVLTIGNDATVSLSLKSKDKEYKFHPTGKSILMEGLNVTTLEEQEGPVAVAAVSSNFKYGCVIPSPAFSDQRKGGFVCRVCIGLDESFRTNYFIPNNQTELDSYEFLGETVDKVSWIFRSVDWDGDGKYDDIGIGYDSQFFHWDYDDDGSENMTASELERFYGDLAKMDFAECCLGLVYTMKRFPGEILAKASPEKAVLESGICAAKDKNGASNNVIIISGNSKQASPFSSMSPDQLAYLTAHEIGKAFGAALDGAGDSKCDSFEDSKGVLRHFLLWPDVVRKGVNVQEKVFSRCAVETIQKTLNTCRSSCFEVQSDPFCGNGIVEVGEECDCGSEIECAKQHCCYARNGKFPCQSTGFECNGGSGSFKQVGSSFLMLGSLFLGGRLLWASMG